MQMTMETFCGLAVLLMAVGGGMALEVPMQVFAGLAVCLLAGAVFALWTVMQDVKHMAWAVESNSSKLLEKVAAKKKTTTKKQQHV
jgi:ABC-type transport system involved in cytochrome bd biosynthesis fused ATPase/permease subunit